MTESRIRNNSEFKTSQAAENDFHKIYEDYNEEEFLLQPRAMVIQDAHKLVV